MGEPGSLVLETRGLVKRFGETVAVGGVDVAVGEGMVCGLLGRNGAGKTTLLRMILGLLPPDTGVVRLFGREAGTGDAATREAVAGFVEEPRFYPYLSARRNLELLARLDGTSASLPVDEALEIVDLARREKDKVRNFSTGMRQRLGIAAALVRAPRLMILDEPTIGLDPASASAVRALVREIAGRGGTVFLSSHNMTEVAEICDSVVIIHEGSVVWDGTLGRLREQAPTAAYRLWTSDDDRARALAREHGIDAAPAPSGALMIRAEDALRDKFVIELAHEEVAVRQLEPDVPPLEALFASLTGDPATAGAAAEHQEVAA
ncbi:MAG TPA: ABC transporter ATP-binding protein [Streptosporangiaceae bacterium]|nr:ABC transporter ATP-binding protein [Streptosporangiaceae bacterium]